MWIYAYDPTIDRRCVYYIHNGIAISLLSGYKFRVDKEFLRQLYI